MVAAAFESVVPPLLLAAVVALGAASTTAYAQQLDLLDEKDARSAPTLPASARIVRDIAYGADPRQKFDLFAPRGTVGAPVILMVHGGAWIMGDKAMARVVDNKAARWVPRGFVFVSTNYRLVPKATPVEQARDVARALAAVQAKAASWGGDPERVILMGHSAGAHLVALLTAAPKIARELGARPWLGAVILDSGALDVTRVMARRHPRFYDRAFGADPEGWKAASPFHALEREGPPMMAVCSTQRVDRPCDEARHFGAAVTPLGRRWEVLERDLSHAEVNANLGKDPEYTAAVEKFMGSLDAAVASRLARPD